MAIINLNQYKHENTGETSKLIHICFECRYAWTSYRDNFEKADRDSCPECNCPRCHVLSTDEKGFILIMPRSVHGDCDVYSE